MDGKISYPAERLLHLKGQVNLQKRRAFLLQKSMAALYTATSLFVASSLAIAINVAYGGPEYNWIATAIALGGGLFLFAASALLLYESRFNLRFVTRHIDFIEFLEDKATRSGVVTPSNSISAIPDGKEVEPLVLKVQ